MTWSIDLTARAWSDLQRLERGVQKRILDKLEAVVGDPAHSFRKLTDRPQYRLRVGEHRLLALLEFQRRTVTVLRVGHRRDVHKG